MAVSRLLRPSTSRIATISACRGTPRVSAVSGALVITTVNANTVTSSPIWDGVTPSDSLISGSSPVGIISLEMERKTVAERAISPIQGNGAGPGERV